MIGYIIGGVILGTPFFGIAYMLIRRQIDLVRKGWTIKGVGRDQIAYVERNNGQIVFAAELGTRPSRRIIQIPATQWNDRMPSWAKDRREEIVQRLKQAMPETQYKYEEE